MRAWIVLLLVGCSSEKTPPAGFPDATTEDRDGGVDPGGPEFAFDVWFGMAVPAATPAPVIARANAALNKVLGDAELKERLARLGYAPRGSSPQEFQDFLRNQITVLTQRAREAGLEQQ